MARELSLSDSTVWQYLRRVREKYARAGRPAESRVDLYLRAVEDKLISPPAPAPEVRNYATLEEAVLAAGGGADSQAAEYILRSIRPLILRYARARLESAHVAEEVTQDVLVALLERLPSYHEQGGPFLAFVYGLAAHKVAESYRRAARRRHKEVLVPDVPDGADDPEQQPEQQELHNELVTDLNALLDSLPDRQREIIVLRVVVGLSVDETAAAIRMPPSSVRVVQHRALAQLRRLRPDLVRD